MELGADNLKCSLQPPLLSSRTATKELEKQNDGLAVDHSAMENDSCLKVSPRYITKNAVQSDIPVMNHSSEDKSLEMIDKTITDKMNDQDDGSATGIIVAYNVLSSPSQGRKSEPAKRRKKNR
ncbi:hypothetical protein C4D60_Mb06t12610 [Musa balbisiana]|uniref:Uncharacterized protein n=1 Tax=Musa balbisiana TaxID=52838 RepID=A0A4S8INA7_MUSBA|nr:hypothetical protein C4D60_Mb06t12610 [Musa balbisiana]